MAELTRQEKAALDEMVDRRAEYTGEPYWEAADHIARSLRERASRIEDDFAALRADLDREGVENGR